MTCTERALSRPRRTRLLALVAAALLVGGVAACGDDDDADVASDDTSATTDTTADDGGDEQSGDDYGGSAGDDGESSGGADAVVAKDFTFSGLTASAGSEVTFKNDDSAPHTMTADDGAFDSGRVEAGASGTVTAPMEPGDYAFHCEIHTAMTGTLTIEA